MRALVQRVSKASVDADGQRVAEIGPGLLVLLGVTHEDTAADADRLADKVRALRIFPDADGRMNRDLREAGGTLAVVSQFTLLGDARKGRRPSWTEAAPPELAEPLVDEVAAEARRAGVPVVTGRFGAAMEVALVNDGPVTVLLDTDRRF